MNSLSEGWAATTLSDVASWGSGGTPSRSNLNYYGGGIPWLKTGELGQRFVSSTEETISEEGLKNSSAKLFPAGAVAIAMYGATIGKTSILCIDAATNQACAVGIPNAELTLKEYLYHYLCSQKEAFVEAGKGGAQPNISQTVIKDWEIPIAPLNEQKRIADKLDAVLARVDACRDRLDHIPNILKRFRQSVLAAATSGRLTDEWHEEANAVDWQQTDVQSVAHVGTGSTPLRSNSTFFASTGTPWVTSAATSLALVTGANEFVTQAAITAHRLKTYPIGTLLVAMYGEGKTRGQVTELGIPATINQACAAIVVNEERALKSYVKLALQANYFEMRELAEGGNQPNLNLSKIKEFPLSLPSITEQTEIVRRIEMLFAYADRLEGRYISARAQVEKLTPATLAKAFRGALVPQDPNDEPASELLECIRNKHNNQSANKPKRGRQSPPTKMKIA